MVRFSSLPTQRVMNEVPSSMPAWHVLRSEAGRATRLSNFVWAKKARSTTRNRQ